jgi:hypothetical protein
VNDARQCPTTRALIAVVLDCWIVPQLSCAWFFMFYSSVMTTIAITRSGQIIGRTLMRGLAVVLAYRADSRTPLCRPPNGDVHATPLDSMLTVAVDH